MPNLRSQTLTDDSITLVASDGRSVTITRAQVNANFTGRTGTRTAKRTATQTWIKQQIQNALGAEQVPIADITIDFDDLAAGRLRALETR